MKFLSDKRITCSRCGFLDMLHTVTCLFDEIRPPGSRFRALEGSETYSRGVLGYWGTATVTTLELNRCLMSIAIFFGGTSPSGKQLNDE